jgi:hypothetical protein
MGAVAETNELAAGVVGVLMLLFWTCGIGGGVCAMLGTGATVSVREESPGILAVTVQKRVAYFPTGESHARACAEGSMLVVRSEFLGSGSSQGTIDAVWIVIVICLCMAGTICPHHPKGGQAALASGLVFGVPVLYTAFDGKMNTHRRHPQTAGARARLPPIPFAGTNRLCPCPMKRSAGWITASAERGAG